MNSKISFEDTSIAFSSKNDAALKKSNLIFWLINYPLLSKLATGFVKFALNIGLPIEGLIKRTVFYHFCGGESIEKSKGAIQQLAQYGIGTILDYAVEGEDSEKDYNNTAEEILRTLQKAKDLLCIPFCVFKITGLASADLLEKIQHKDVLNEAEQIAWENINRRVDTICRKAYEHNIAVLIDAEETWIQEPLDTLANLMMQRYNRDQAIIFNTYQLYRVDTLAKLQLAVAHAELNNYFLGAKLVRGAYMEKERDRAKELNYPSPVYLTKEATDNAFNHALDFCVNNIDRLAMVCGSHNEYSNYYLTDLMQKQGISLNDKRIWFAQLYGMGDNISYNLAKAGCNVAKYVPYGPVKSVIPYLIRRAEENTSVSGQSSRELTLIRKELKRRKQPSRH